MKLVRILNVRFLCFRKQVWRLLQTEWRVVGTTFMWLGRYEFCPRKLAAPLVVLTHELLK